MSKYLLCTYKCSHSKHSHHNPCLHMRMVYILWPCFNIATKQFRFKTCLHEKHNARAFPPAETQETILGGSSTAFGSGLATVASHRPYLVALYHTVVGLDWGGLPGQVDGVVQLGVHGDGHGQRGLTGRWETDETCVSVSTSVTHSHTLIHRRGWTTKARRTGQGLM